MKNLVLSIVFVFSVVIVFSQSVFWEITGNKLDKPAYLYGTIHIQDKLVFSYDKIVEEKLKSCEGFAMEILMEETPPEEMKKAMLMENNTLQDLLSEDDYNLLDSVMKAKTGQSLFIFNKMKPFFISSQLMQADMNKDMPLALDLHFLEIAKNAGLKTFGVEKFEHQMKAVDEISLDDQCKMLMEGAKDTTKSKEMFKDLLDAYISGDLDKMLELSADTSMPENFNQAFLIDRNKVMAKNAHKLLKKHRMFIAVGAAHLAGEKGVINLLRKKGYTVKPIKLSFDKAPTN